MTVTINGNQILASDLLTMHWSLLATALILILASNTGRSRTHGESYGVKRVSCEYRGVTDFAGSGLTYRSPFAVLPRQGNPCLFQTSILLLIFHLRASSWGRVGT